DGVHLRKSLTECRCDPFAHGARAVAAVGQAIEALEPEQVTADEESGHSSGSGNRYWVMSRQFGCFRQECRTSLYPSHMTRHPARFDASGLEGPFPPESSVRTG